MFMHCWTNTNKLEKTQGHVESLVKEKFTHVSEKSYWLKNMKIVRDILQGLNPSELLCVKHTLMDIAIMKYVLITFV